MKRSEVKENYKWKLEDIFATDEEWEKVHKEVQGEIKQILSYKGKLANAKNLLACLTYIDGVSIKFEKLYCYARMRRDENSVLDKYVAMCDRIDATATALFTATSFVNPELSKTSEEYLDELIKKQEFAPYAYMLSEVKRSKKHILSEKEEKILALAGNATGSYRDVFEKIDYIDLPLPKIKDENGKKVQLTQGLYSYFLQSSDPVVRKHAFDALYKAYYGLINTITATYAGHVKADNFYAETRGYKSALEKALFEDNVPEGVYENLLDAVSENLSTVHDYVALRKKALGQEKLHMYDMYVSIVPDAERQMDFDEAFELVVEGLKPLGEEYHDLLIRAKEERWMDVYETENKRTGAYSWGSYGTHPYVLLNHSNTMHDTFTIAHELGHAMHSYYSDGAQPYSTAQYSIFVAEVASTVNEVLLLKYMIANAKSKEEKKYLLTYYLDMFRTTLFRQTMFAEFEKISHSMAAKGMPLTPKSLSDKYYKLNKKYYGRAVTHDNLIRYEWARIPHFYTAFYVYKYATGITSAVNIASDILKEGAPAVERYKKFLQSGGSNSPYELLKIANVDLMTKAPFEKAMGEFRETLEQLKKEF
ncbi:MAG: oligoendopeptidase F [Clostridia bacterium]|nr:oligoendopeptidase F [Clostridia bacterium]MBQ7223961.1 oligoendopeptidase F [Clostridia bacterium]